MNEICDNNPWYGCGCPEHTDRDRKMRHRHGRGTVTLIRVRRPELMYKVANAAAIVKDSIPDNDKTHEMRKWVEDLTDDGNVDRVTDLLDLAFSDLLEWLDSRLDEDSFDGDIDLDARDDYSLVLRKGVTSIKAFGVLKPRVEEYMVAYVLWQWLLHKGFASLAAPWAAELEELKGKICSVLTDSRAKRPLSPF